MSDTIYHSLRQTRKTTTTKQSEHLKSLRVPIECSNCSERYIESCKIISANNYKRQSKITFYVLLDKLGNKLTALVERKELPNTMTNVMEPVNRFHKISRKGTCAKCTHQEIIMEKRKESRSRFIRIHLLEREAEQKLFF